jgi:hypothetical protein
MNRECELGKRHVFINKYKSSVQKLKILSIMDLLILTFSPANYEVVIDELT